MKKTKNPKSPKPTELRIKIVPLDPEPLSDGNFLFYCAFPRTGSPDMHIMAKTAERAKGVLENFLRYELDGHDALEDW